MLSPLLLAIAIAVKLDSPGPVFYSSERIGKKGRVFRCIKFRTMVRDAEKRRADVMHMNERDGVLFKISNDPRITKLGRFLRKYSLDELPQFFNVLRGDMSIVGPRPPLASEVQEYKLSHLRRLDVTARHHRPVAGAGAPGPFVRQLYLAGCDLHRELEHLAGFEDHCAHHRRGSCRNRLLSAIPCRAAAVGASSAGGVPLCLRRIKLEDVKIALAQINPTVGDFTGNLEKIVAASRRAAALGARLTVFSELAICGYPPADFLEKPSFLARCRTAVDELAAATQRSADRGAGGRGPAGGTATAASRP